MWLKAGLFDSLKAGLFDSLKVCLIAGLFDSWLKAGLCNSLESVVESLVDSWFVCV